MDVRHRRGDTAEKEFKVKENDDEKENKKTRNKKAQVVTPRRQLSCVSACLVIAIIAVIVIVMIPSPIEPLSYEVQEAPAFEGVLAPNNILTKAERILENEIVGPESIAVNGDYIYTGLLNGDLIEIHKGKQRTLMHFGKTPCEFSEGNCGRPLGIRFKGDFLYMIDTYYGLVKIHAKFGVTELLWHATNVVNGHPSTFTDDLTVAQDGTIYFTQASTKWFCYQFIECVMEGDQSGRVLKYSPKSRQVTELLRGIRFPNGIQLSKNEDFLLFAELTEHQIWKYFLTGPRTGEKEIFINNLPGYPDNIRLSSRGGFWVALGGVRMKGKFNFLDFTASMPWIRSLFLKLVPSEFILNTLPRYGLAIELDESGRIVRSLHDPTGEKVHSLTEVMEQDGFLYLGSYALPYLSRIDMSLLGSKEIP